MRGENGNVLAFLSRAIGAATYARQIVQAADDSNTHPWLGASSIDIESFRRNLVATFVHDVLHPPKSAIAIGFKEIRHGIIEMSEQEYDDYIEFLLTSFEEPCLIFNVRRWGDVAKSEWWLSNPFAKSHLRVFERRFGRTMRSHPACTFRVEYEKYVNDPDELRALFDFLGANYERTLVENVLAVAHGYHSPESELERLRSARSFAASIIDALARRVRRLPTGHYH
jgi:hypothetical protein